MHTVLHLTVLTLHSGLQCCLGALMTGGWPSQGPVFVSSCESSMLLSAMLFGANDFEEKLVFLFLWPLEQLWNDHYFYTYQSRVLGKTAPAFVVNSFRIRRPGNYNELMLKFLWSQSWVALLFLYENFFFDFCSLNKTNKANKQTSKRKKAYISTVSHLCFSGLVDFYTCTLFVIINSCTHDPHLNPNLNYRSITLNFTLSADYSYLSKMSSQVGLQEDKSTIACTLKLWWIIYYPAGVFGIPINLNCAFN